MDENHRHNPLTDARTKIKTRATFGEQGWRSGESARLSPMCLGFDSRTRRHTWVEFVVGSFLAPRGFSPGIPVFRSPQKPTFSNSKLLPIIVKHFTGMSLWSRLITQALPVFDIKFAFTFLHLHVLHWGLALSKPRRLVLHTTGETLLKYSCGTCIAPASETSTRVILNLWEHEILCF